MTIGASKSNDPIALATDYSERYKTRLCKPHEPTGPAYCVVNEATGVVVDHWPRTYDEAQKVADRLNDTVALRRATA